MMGTYFGGNRHRKITNRMSGSSAETNQNGSTGSTVVDHRTTNFITTFGCNVCQMFWRLTANVSYIVLYLALGFIFGLFLLFLFYLLSAVSSNPSMRISTTGFDATTTTKTIADLLLQEAAKNHKDDTNRCIIPFGTTTVDIQSTNDNESTQFQLVVHSEETNDFLSSHIIKNGFWEIRSIEELAALSPSLTIPKSTTTTISATGTINTTTTTFYDIGANIGYYSFLFAAAGYNVVAFEPIHSNNALFRASMCLNTHLSHRIRLYDYIISNISSSDDVEGTKDCKLVGRVNGRTRKYLYSIPQLNCDVNYHCRPDVDLLCQRNVTLSSLHHFVRNLHPDVPLPNIMKLDVEGHELSILQSVFDNNMQHQRGRRIEPTIIQYENKNARAAPFISSILTINGYRIGTKRGHDANTIAEYQPPKLSKLRRKSIRR